MYYLSSGRGARAARVVAIACAGVVATLSTPADAAMPVLSPQVQTYVVHAQPLLAITHVRVIDGDGT
ncbi:MAG TPA: amidohydrolase, partial [Rhodanobacter sp.]|nr:amidohydrolase [Rhodanobacter sp.]